MLGYRTTHVDVMPLNGEKFGDAKWTLTGVEQVGEFDPYTENRFQTSAWQAGIEVYGTGDCAVFYNRGDWTGVSGVNFSQGAKSITINAGSEKGATIRISTESPSGKVIGYITIPSTGDNYKYQDITAEITEVTGKQNIFFVASGDCVLNSYKFSA
jgi:arabinoxylan arabinofuranohydrolase